MRIAYISDIHLDVSIHYPVLETLGEVVREQGADLLVIAGDISEDYRRTISAVEYLNSIVPTYYVPGNHDLWIPKDTALSNEDIYRIYSEDEHCLVNKPLLLSDDTVIIGDIGWYDYSLALEDFPLSELEAMKRNGRTWQDKLRNRFTDDNVRKCQYMLNKLEAQLIRYQSVPNRIVVTHMIPVKEFSVPASVKDWSYFNAFLGSLRMRDLFEHYGVTLSVSGHVHYRSRVMHGATTYICPCLGYEKEWPLTGLDPENVRLQIEDSLMII